MVRPALDNRTCGSISIPARVWQQLHKDITRRARFSPPVNLADTKSCTAAVVLHCSARKTGLSYIVPDECNSTAVLLYTYRTHQTSDGSPDSRRRHQFHQTPLQVARNECVRQRTFGLVSTVCGKSTPDAVTTYTCRRSEAEVEEGLFGTAYQIALDYIPVVYDHRETTAAYLCLPGFRLAGPEGTAEQSFLGLICLQGRRRRFQRGNGGGRGGAVHPSSRARQGIAHGVSHIH